MLLVSKAILLGSIGVFFVCVLLMICCPLVIMIQLGRTSGNLNSLSLPKLYLSSAKAGGLPDNLQGVVMFMRRVSRVADKAWWIALLTALSHFAIAVTTTSN